MKVGIVGTTYKHEALVQTTLCQNLSSNMSRQMDSEKNRIFISSQANFEVSMWSINPELFFYQTLTKDIDLKKMIVKTWHFKVPSKFCVLDKFFEARITSESSISKSKFTQTKLNLLEEPSEGQSRTFWEKLLQVGKVLYHADDERKLVSGFLEIST